MTDQRLRDLERDAAHGDLQARARLLLERVRVGELTEDKLRLAAHLGDEAACAALGTGGQRLVMNADWFRGLTPWSPALAVWALAEACASRHEPEDELLLREVRLGLRTAFISGKAVDFARSMPAAELSPLCFGSASGKSLVLWLERLKQDGRRSRLDHPEILRALDEVRSRFSPQEVGELSYA